MAKICQTSAFKKINLQILRHFGSYLWPQYISLSVEPICFTDTNTHLDIHANTNSCLKILTANQHWCCPFLPILPIFLILPILPISIHIQGDLNLILKRNPKTILASKVKTTSIIKVVSKRKMISEIGNDQKSRWLLKWRWPKRWRQLPKWRSPSIWRWP